MGDMMNIDMTKLVTQYDEEIIIEDEFLNFLEEHKSDFETAEYLLPTIMGSLLEKEKVEIKVLESHDTWFGVTYKEDKEKVVNEIGKLIAAGLY